jgi:hypothetical protein
LRRLSVRGRLLLVAGLTLVVAGLAVAPAPLGSPVRRLANYEPDPPGPIFNTPIDDAAVARAAKLMPADAVYAIVDGELPYENEPNTVLHHDLLGASFIHLLPAVPSRSLAGAGWALVYKQPLPGVPIAARYPLGPGITLLKLGRP